MEKIKFSETINAPGEKVWRVLWDDKTYRQWTKPFSEESHAKLDLREGGRAVFLDGNNCGMYSEIAKLVPNKVMSFKHLGSIKDGKDIPFEGEMECWTGSHETYTLTETDGVTELVVVIDLIESFRDFMMEKFPQVLGIAKRLSEEGE